MTSISNPQHFGQFIEGLPISEEYLTLHFSPVVSPRRDRWRNYGLSADFLGDYFANFFPGNVPLNDHINQKDAVKAAVSYIANELLENAVKFNDEVSNRPISISLYLHKKEIVFNVINYCSSSIAEKYQVFIEELVRSDIDDLYMRQLEKTAMGEGESKMGLLTMINDYSARLGWKFEPLEDNPQLIQVNVIASLEV
jgi:hypothetical protein